MKKTLKIILAISVLLFIALCIIFSQRPKHDEEETELFLKYRADEETLSEDTDIKVLEDLYRITNTINETDQTRTQNIMKYMSNLEN